MAFIAMSTANPLGRRPFLSGDFDFPGAPIPDRDPVLVGRLAGFAQKEILHPPAPVDVLPVSEIASPWTSLAGPVMTLGAEAVTSTQTLVPTTNTTPQTTAAVPGGTSVQQSWFAKEDLIPGLSNMEVIGIGLGIIGIGFALRS